MKRPKWLGESRATKADKQKKARQQTDQRMKHHDAQSRGDSKRKAKMVAPTIPWPRPREKAAPDRGGLEGLAGPFRSAAVFRYVMW